MVTILVMVVGFDADGKLNFQPYNCQVYPDGVVAEMHFELAKGHFAKRTGHAPLVVFTESEARGQIQPDAWEDAIELVEPEEESKETEWFQDDSIEYQSASQIDHGPEATNGILIKLKPGEDKVLLEYDELVLAVEELRMEQNLHPDIFPRHQKPC